MSDNSSVNVLKNDRDLLTIFVKNMEEDVFEKALQGFNSWEQQRIRTIINEVGTSKTSKPVQDSIEAPPRFHRSYAERMSCIKYLRENPEVCERAYKRIFCTGSCKGDVCQCDHSASSGQNLTNRLN